MADAKKTAAGKPAGAGATRESDSGLKASDVEACARWLREAWSGLESHDGVQFEKRVSYFRGDELIDRLCALSATPGVAAAREAARDARCAAADAERKQARADARAAAAAQVAAQRGGRAPTAKEAEHDKRRAERDARYEREMEEADAKRIAARRKRHATLARKRTFRNAAIEAFVTSERDAVLLATRMMHAGYFHRSQIVTTRRHELDDGDDVKLELHRQQKSFDDTAWTAANPAAGAVYTWLIYPSQRTVWVQSALLALGVIFVCCIKVWPLWLKIVVWWLSLILLVTLLSIMAVRLVLFAAMWIVGFRGIWLFPNMFEDDLDLLEAFTPLIGRGRSAALPPKRGATAAQLAAPVPEEDGYFQFGGANVAILLVIGVVTCYQLGVFQGENIPEFVISQQDLWKNYGHLLPPPSNTSTWASPNIDATSATRSDADAAAADAADDGADADAEEAEAEDDTAASA